ncbi:nitroreductase family protein [Devriesea agamarum]|uniref:hypothetical protein n=1 Tax=Devriesea agamarum TaxID=472569 RepID=UPI00071E0B09|nr:hypothetical protein [Devriesea agamarum]
MAVLPSQINSLLTGLWGSRGYHCGADGRPTRIRQRPIPSAGGTYAVQTHLAIGYPGAYGLEPGRYVLDHERDLLLRRRDSSRPLPTGAWLIFSVQPGRSFGRYQHRSWPLWIADTAYALVATQFLLNQPLPPLLGPSDQLRELSAVARGSDTSWWVQRGLAPEIPLAAVRLPGKLRVCRDRSTALALRRSPSHASFASNLEGARNNHARELAVRSGQSWVAGADRVEAWSVRLNSPSQSIFQMLWTAHQRAARLTYDSALSGIWRCRPISGFPATSTSWIVHALAMLRVRDTETLS